MSHKGQVDGYKVVCLFVLAIIVMLIVLLALEVGEYRRIVEELQKVLEEK